MIMVAKQTFNLKPPVVGLCQRNRSPTLVVDTIQKMIIVALALSLLSFPFQTAAFNASNLVSSPPVITNTNNNNNNHHRLFKDIVNAISVKHGWDLEQVRVSHVDVKNARVGGSQKHEFRMRMGKTDVVFKFSEESDSWKKLRRRRRRRKGEFAFADQGEFGELLNEVSSKTALNKFKLDGPFELSVSGEDDELTLVLPMNVTHTGLKRLLVSGGITVEVEGSREVSLFHASDFGLPINKSSNVSVNRNQFWPLRHSSCMPLPPVHIYGSASLVAYRTRNPRAHLETAVLSQGMVELLPEKCYSRLSHKKQPCPIHALNPRLELLEKLMKSFLGDKIIQNGVSGFLKAKITSATLVQFQLELERDIRDNDTFWGTVEEWRTKPTTERLQFEVVARVEAERLKPVVVKRVRPFILSDTTALSTLMSNISFTKFPAVFVPPEALTLDVKW